MQPFRPPQQIHTKFTTLPTPITPIILTTLIALITLVVGALGPLVSLSTPSAHAQIKEIIIDERQADITIQPNGDVTFDETWKVRFLEGRFTRVMHEIPHAYIGEVTDWEIREGGHSYDEDTSEEPDTYTIRSDEESTTATWYFPRTQNRTRTFNIKYTLKDALRVFPELESDQFFWEFITPDHPYQVLDAEAIVHLPAEFDEDELDVASYRNGTLQDEDPSVEEDQVTFTGGPFDPGVRWELSVLFPEGETEAERQPWQDTAENIFRHTTGVAVEKRDAEMTIETDGSVKVVETWEVDIQGGPYRSASLSIPTDHVTDIAGWGVSEEGEAYEEDESGNEQTYTLSNNSSNTSDEDSGEQATITWHFPLTQDDSRTFTINYTLEGAVRIYSEADQFIWPFIQGDRNYTIDEARVAVYLPEGVETTNVNASIALNDEQTRDGVEAGSGMIAFTGGPFVSGDTWEVRTEFPHGSLEATAPAWQPAEETAPEAVEVETPSQSSGTTLYIIGAVVALALIGGIAFIWKKLPSE
jgi:hypothetical protein